MVTAVDVPTWMNTTGAAAAAALVTAQGYLNNLVTVTSGQIVEGTTVLPEQYNYNSVPIVNFPILGATRPTISTGTLASIPSAPAVGFSAFEEIALPADDLAAPTSVFSFAEAAYVSILLDPLKSKLLDNLTNGGYGIETADEIALFNRARDREVEAMMMRVADAGRSMAARGFPLPPGELSIHIDRAYQDLQDKVSTVSRDITLERDKLYVENRKFTITEIRQVEQVLMNYWNSVQERAFNVARMSAEFGITVYNAVVARYRTRFEAAKISSDVQFQEFQVQTEQVRALLDQYRGSIAAYEAQLRGIVEPARLQTEIYRADIDAVRTTNDASIARAGLQEKVLEATKQQNIQIDNMTIENARVRILGVIESLKFKTEAEKFGASNYFALLQALEGTVNTLATQAQTV